MLVSRFYFNLPTECLKSMYLNLRAKMCVRVEDMKGKFHSIINENTNLIKQS